MSAKKGSSNRVIRTLSHMVHKHATHPKPRSKPCQAKTSNTLTACASFSFCVHKGSRLRVDIGAHHSRTGAGEHEAAVLCLQLHREILLCAVTHATTTAAPLLQLLLSPLRGLYRHICGTPLGAWARVPAAVPVCMQSRSMLLLLWMQLQAELAACLPRVALFRGLHGKCHLLVFSQQRIFEDLDRG